MQGRTHVKAGKPLGDRVADFTHITGLNNLSDAYEHITGRSRGCDESRQLLNRLLPCDSRQSHTYPGTAAAASSYATSINSICMKHHSAGAGVDEMWYNGIRDAAGCLRKPGFASAPREILEFG